MRFNTKRAKVKCKEHKDYILCLGLRIFRTAIVKRIIDKILERPFTTLCL
jgi:ribose 5-phosphate isomerase RpiB